MKCKTIHKNLIFFLEGDLPASEMEQITAHLSGCKECAAFAEEMRKTLFVLNQEKSPKVNPFLYTRIKARLESQSMVGKNLWKPALVKVLQPVFFSILLLVGIYAGIKVGNTASYEASVYSMQNKEILFLNEMEAETIEKFLME